VGTRERREREKQQRRQDILDAARKLFWARGFEGTTMPQIAASAELAPGTLYLYFTSKQALYAELLFEGYEMLRERMEGAVSGGGDARALAEAVIDVFLGFSREHPEYFDIIFFVIRREGHAMSELALEPDQVARLTEYQNACVRVAADVLRSAELGLSEEKLLLLVDTVWSMLAGVVLYFHRDAPETFGAVAETAKAVVLKAIFEE